MTVLLAIALILAFILIRLLYRRMSILEQQTAYLLSKDAQRNAAQAWTGGAPKPAPKVPSVKGLS